MSERHRFTCMAMALALTLAAVGASAEQDTEQSPALAPSFKTSAVKPESQPSRRNALSARQLDAETVSYNYLGNYIAQNMSNAEVAGNDYEFRTKRVEEDSQSMMHTHVQQMYRGIPVFGGEAIVHLEPDEYSPSITDDLVRSVQVNTAPKLTAAEAVKIAVAKYGCESCLTAKPKTDLWVMRPAKRARDALVYRVQLRREDGTAETALPIYFIDAHTGAIVMNYNNLQSGTGLSLYSGTRTINTYFIVINPPARTYFMEDHIRNFGIFDGRSTTNSSFYITDADNRFNAAFQRAAVDAHLGTSKTLDYYKTTFNRNGLDGRGGPAYFNSADGVTRLKSVTVHYGNRLNNGFWNGNQVVLGDGDGMLFSPVVSVDWLGHEWTHALTQYTANLVYQGESGALNESMSDVFGALIERFTFGENSNTWKIFERTWTPAIAGDATRDMESPHKARNNGFTADDDPDHYTERYRGTADNGGVHINSGITNKVFHLVAKGGAHHRGGSMTGIGADKAAKIWYRALTVYMTRTTNFKGARTATLNAARSLYGLASPEHAAVARAWQLCGVT